MKELFETLLPEAFIRTFALTLFHSIWQGALLAILSGAVLFILRKSGPSVRYGILFFLMMLMPLFFAGTFYILYNPAEQSVLTAIYPETGNGIIGNPDLNLNEDGINVMGLIPWYDQLVNRFEEKAQWLVLLWFTGFMFFFTRFWGSIFYVYRVRTSRNYPVDKHWHRNLEILSGKIGLKKKVKLAESALAGIPITIGYLKPVILLPIGTLSNVPPQQIDAILLHELAHIFRKDYLMNIFQSVIELLFFYHPFTWWISRLIRQEREHICDDIAIAVNHDQLNYIKALSTMEELNSKSPILASAITGSKKHLLARVRRILSPVRNSKGFSEGIIAFILLVSLVSALSLNALSTIPSNYDLTGRESGGNVHNLLAFLPEQPDTIRAISSSGRVKITVYTDSTMEGQQKALQEMAESIERKSDRHDRMEERYVVHVNSSGEPGPVHREEKKVIVIEKCDTMTWNGSAPHTADMQYFYSYPGDSRGGDVNVRIFRYSNDSIDTLVFIGSGMGENLEDMMELEEYKWNEQELQDLLQDQQMDLKEFQWNEEEYQEQMREIQIDIESDMPAGEYRTHEFYFDEPVYTPRHRGYEIEPRPPVPQSEKIIRQELRDDGLTTRGRKYVVEIDGKSMYINGEKQPKEVYKKYRKLVESTEQVSFEGDETFKMIF